MKRVILHCDCNSFFASVETVLNPEYKNVPMAVCGSQEDRHGIVLAKNELAKSYNIQTAETVYSAKKKCPSLVIAEPHYKEYTTFSRRVNDIYARYTDMIEPFGIDESWLDVTASRKLFGDGVDIAQRIRHDVKKEIGITVSIGVSFNKVFAKLGSDYKKPDAITEISEENFKDIIFPLPASSLLFVGKKTEASLREIGVKTIGELAATSKELLVMRLGKAGEMLYNYANGLDDTPVCAASEPSKSISNGFTFRRDLLTMQDCRTGIDFLCEEIGRKLRVNSQVCSTVALTLKDIYLQSIQRQLTLDMPTDVGKEIADAAFSILKNEWHEGKPIRSITVSVSRLTNSCDVKTQISMFENPNEEKRKINKKKELSVDMIRQKYGDTAIFNGSLIDTDIGIFDSKKEK